jgi:hypothetical protein
MTRQDIVHAIRKERGKTISQSYLSQIERGTRPHLTNSTRMPTGCVAPSWPWTRSRTISRAPRWSGP